MSNKAYINCTVITGHPDDDPIDDAVIVVGKEKINGTDRGNILAIGRKMDVSIPEHVQKIDLKGQYVLPGLINAHSHAIMDGRPRAPLSEKAAARMMRFGATWLGGKVMKKRIKANMQNALNAGTTTVRSVGIEPVGTFYEASVRDEFDAGKLVGPRLLTAGTLVVPSGQFGELFPPCDGPWAIRAAVRNNYRGGVDLIKTGNTGAVNLSRKIGDAGRPGMTPDELRACVDEAHRCNLLVAAHSQSMQGVKEALICGVDTIEHGAEVDDEMVDLYLKNPNALRGYSAMIPTISAGRAIIDHADEKIVPYTHVQLGNAKIVLERIIKGFQRCLKEGVAIGCGNDAAVPYVTQYNVWKELKYFVEYGGVSHQYAIYMGTLATAKILGIDDETGSLEPGKSPDFMVVDQNPLQNLNTLAKPTKVSMRGILIDDPEIKLVEHDTLT